MWSSDLEFFSVRGKDLHPSRRRHLEAKAAFVDETVMRAAQGHEIARSRLSSFAPKENMVDVDVSPLRAPEPPAAPVTDKDRSSHAPWDRPGQTHRFDAS